MLPPTVASIPEAKEEYLGSSLIERTGRLHSFADLGPADLCNLHKQSTTSKKNTEIGTFLYFTGVDTSNSASIAAHLQGLATLIGSKSQYWFGEKKHWKVPQLTYCTYNAFSKVDMRVTVHIPGKFESSIVNHEGKLIQDKVSKDEADNLWLETFVSSIVRSVLDSDEDDANKVGGLVEIRKINPFGSKLILDSFMAGFEKLFYDGPKLGCGIEIPQPTLINNYLVDGFLKCVQLAQNYDQALEILTRLHENEPSVITLIAHVYLLMDEEVKAIQVMNEGVSENKRDANLVLLQAQFCLDKKRYDLALDLSKQAVKSSPSDFKTWSMLVKAYTKLGDFENALLSLNSCPMNSHKEKFSLKRVVPLRSGNEDLHLPSPIDVTLEEVSNLQSNDIAYEQRNLDPQLSNLPASNLKSTFAQAYDLLTEIVVKTGWESLLKYRAKVFVMEEEYRKDRNGHKQTPSVTNINEVPNGTTEVTTNGEANDSTTEPTLNPDSLVGENDVSSTLGVKSPKREVETEANDDESYENEFKKKRLCERWLDNLFMLLYEDLRAYTMWQAESLHFQAQQMEYKKTTLEWEILGSIAYRLKHYKEGSVAFNNALSGRFSAKSQREMLKYYQMERSKILSKNSTNSSNANSASTSYTHNYTKIVNQLNEKILESTIKLLVWNHRWYSDFSPSLITTISDLVAKEGLIKIQSLVQAVYSNNISTGGSDSVGNHGITDMMDSIFEFLTSYAVTGADN
ncbi:chaps-domain-containing protein [Suhomyces tanzawaensis NRRL Y-17324]|uniref:Chaps-domain-containing protein n=1 Tax=Suhomyces tanzawaensis NRRL Y-17324 TaxID=984487 RepID=A0A1E4SGM3_9ASCO|nr:chaps-domain-containing protein [Suhomyces tanzawaensis NRRL Y-17324]ODV78620.1 chaps-domain-containing protein [Suhomyces tanzawaensis NRRL Y-17324]